MLCFRSSGVGCFRFPTLLVPGPPRRFQLVRRCPEGKARRRARHRTSRRSRRGVFDRRRRRVLCSVIPAIEMAARFTFRCSAFVATLLSLDARAVSDRSLALRNCASKKNGTVGGNSCTVGTRRCARNGPCCRVRERSVKRLVTSRYGKEDFFWPLRCFVYLLSLVRRPCSRDCISAPYKNKQAGRYFPFVAVDNAPFFFCPRTSCLINFCQVLLAPTMRHCFVT